MGSFDEFAQAEEDMKELGDTPPVITQEADPAEGATEEPGEMQVVDEGMSGGLGERTIEGEDAPFSIEDVLGIGGNTEAPAEEGQPAEEKAGESEAPQTGVDARLSEMSERLRRTEEQNALLVKQALQTEAPSGEQEGSHEVELEADVREYMKPYIEAELGSRMKAMEESMAPMRKEAENVALAEQIAINVEGFTASDVPKLQAAFDAIPQDQQGLYEGSVAGATLLAQKLAKQGSFGQKTQRKTLSKLGSRHQSESGSGVAGYGGDAVDEAEKIRRINNLSDDQTLAILEQLGLG